MLQKLLVFTIGFLTFQIQLLETKALLPSFGGSAAVWLGSLLFYQGALFFSYFISYYFINTKEKLAFLSLISWSLFFLLQNTINSTNPLINLIVTLITSSGLLYILLLNFNPHLQKISKDPYSNYAYSNLGAFLGLLSYPLFFESIFSISSQKNIWIIAAALVTLFSLILLFDKKEEETLDKPKIYFAKDVVWYSFLGNLLLGTFSYYLTQDLVSFPFLWVLPLLMFLLSYILVFKPLKIPNINNSFLEVWVLLIVSGILTGLNMYVLIVLHNLLFLFVSIKIQKKLYDLKPDKYYLSFYYLLLALGGLIAGVTFNVFFPLIFKNPIDFTLCLLLILLTFSLSKKNKISLLGLILVVGTLEFYKSQFTIKQDRNFYGNIKLVQKDDIKAMYHGNIVHGEQYKLETTPRGYYAKETLLGKTILELQENKESLKIAVIGMGAGVISSYLRSDDYLDFYEINPLVVKYAKEEFLFLSKSLGHKLILLGDGRLELEKRKFSAYDLIIIDAFNGDSIPHHLITKEAMDLYHKKTKEDAVWLFHISNNYLDLYPQLQAQAKVQGFYVYQEKNKAQEVISHWVKVNKNIKTEKSSHFKYLWSDDYSSIWPYLK